MTLHNCREIRTLGDYDRMMRRFEVVADGATLPDMYLVIRADAHRHLDWSGEPGRPYPFGDSFINSLQRTAADILSEFDTFSLSFVHGDEISLLLQPKMSKSERRRVRLVSLVASACAASFLRHHGKTAIFHCVLSELPTLDHVVSYFMWQRLVAERNYLSWLFATQIEQQRSEAEAAELKREFAALSIEQRIAFLNKYAVEVASRNSYERLGQLLIRTSADKSMREQPSVEDERYLHQLIAHLTESNGRDESRKENDVKPSRPKETESSRFRVGKTRARVLPSKRRL